MDLVDYLRRNVTDHEESENHGQLLDKIINESQSFGIPDPHELFRKVPLMVNGSEIGRPDLIFLISKGYLYLVEAKCLRKKVWGSLRGTKGNIKIQLSIGYDFFKDKFGIEPKMIGVYKNSGSIYYHEIRREITDVFSDHYDRL
ncbi:hypothetical protein K8R47_02440 [archaeon]|nr:hypothetical protein [archaeon]